MTENETSKAAVAPRAFALEVTKGCNLRCGYCYYAERDTPYDPEKRMSPEVARQSVDRLIADGPPGETLHLHFFGGEPLLNFPLIAETTEYAERRADETGRSFTFEVTTNGTCFTENVIDFLNAHAFHIGVSIDGPPEVQDVARPAFGKSSYGLAIDGIKRMLASRRGTPLEKKVHASVVVTRREIDVRKICRHLEDAGFPKIILTPATDLTGRTYGISPGDLPLVFLHFEELARETECRIKDGRHEPTTWFLRLLDRIASGKRRTQFCSGGVDYLGVAADGEVALCYRFFEQDRYGMGNVATGIDGAVKEMVQNSGPDEKTDCRRCWARYFCGGGCHHDNVSTTGGLDRPNEVSCDIFRWSMDRALEMWAKTASRGAAERRVSDTMKESKKERVFKDSDRPKRRAECHVRKLPGEQVVYEPASHELAVLNETASFIFENLDGQQSIAEILDLLVRRYAAPRDVLAADLAQTIREFERRSLID